MPYQVTSDNIEISPSMISLAEGKLARLEHLLKDIPDDLKSIRVVLNSGPNETFIARVEASLRGRVYYGEGSGFTLENALIQAVENVDRQYVKEKSKKESEDWKAGRELKESFDEADD